MTQKNEYVPFVPDAELEARALALLDRYSAEIEPITTLPVPIEEIVDLLLRLTPDWKPIQDTDEHPILGLLDPATNTLQLNTRRQAWFQAFPGSYQYTLAHEVGHHQLHLVEPELEQLPLDSSLAGRGFLCREKSGTTDRRELQAERYAAYLLLPKHLLLPALEGIDLMRWSVLKDLQAAFHVSISALVYRLQGLGLIYVQDKRIYRSAAEATGQMSLF
ncbi:MAG: ImmA/IrrE family metallo-endopeptidase [Anaerolineales bacterium]|nr:ImmA/IrrE family metallo-endopeptidase [Anaerolineales bacterium]